VTGGRGVFTAVSTVNHARAVAVKYGAGMVSVLTGINTALRAGQCLPSMDTELKPAGCGGLPLSTCGLPPN
jgi:hypothetical protein